MIMMSADAVHGPNLVRMLSAAPKKIMETDPLPSQAQMERMRGTLVGYPQSKWVMEQLARQASKRGVPIVVYRPGTF